MGNDVRIGVASIERIQRERDSAQKAAILLEAAIYSALSELGMPHEATPAPVVNAHRLLRDALIQCEHGKTHSSSTSERPGVQDGAAR